MKKYWISTIAAGLILAVVAGVCRASFTEMDNLEAFQVALLPDTMVDGIKSDMDSIQAKSPYILKVKCTSDVIFSFLMVMQSVEVECVYRGEDIHEGDIIEIASCNSWIFSGDMSLNMGFVNVMEEGKEYLVFLDDPVTAIDEPQTVYYTSECLLTTVFAYQDHENAVPELEDSESTYVSYEEVKNNEFFVTSEEGIEKLNEMKHRILEMYP